MTLHETQEVVTKADGTKFVNGAPASDDNQLRLVGHMSSIAGDMDTETGPVNPFKFLALIGDPETTINLWKSIAFTDGEDKVSVYYSVAVSTNPSVTSGQSVRFSFERPCRALVLCGTSPSK